MVLRCLVVLSIVFASVPLQGEETASVSPKEPWGDFTIVEEPDRPWWTHALLWVPNRVADLWDIFRVDVGLGSAYGGVVRVTEHGQLGYRSISPASVRVGAFGRQAPVMIENSSEFGVGPGYVNSSDRRVCKGEIGVGVDLVAGAYVGVCSEEVFDFLAGLFFFDIMEDDLR